MGERVLVADQAALVSKQYMTLETLFHELSHSLGPGSITVDGRAPTVSAELKESGEFIGYVGLHTPAAQLPFSPCVEIGWRLAFEHWRKGLATEAAK